MATASTNGVFRPMDRDGTLGESAGRNASSPVHGGRRMSDDERAANTHVKDDPQEWPGELKAEERPQTTLVQKFRFATFIGLNWAFTIVVAYLISGNFIATKVGAFLLTAYTSI